MTRRQVSWQNNGTTTVSWGWRWTDDTPGTCRQFKPKYIQPNEQLSIVGLSGFTYNRVTAQRILRRWRAARYRANIVTAQRILRRWRAARYHPNRVAKKVQG